MTVCQVDSSLFRAFLATIGHLGQGVRHRQATPRTRSKRVYYVVVPSRLPWCALGGASANNLSARAASLSCPLSVH